MGRIRTVKPELAKHSGLFDLEKETGLPLRFAWPMLFTQCDRDGRFKWRPRELKVEILPYDDLDFSRVLDAWLTRGFIVKYASQGQEYGAIPTWDQHQFINNREKPSSIPPPPQAVLDEWFNACGTRVARETDACKKEGKGKEGKGRERPAPDTPAQDSSDEFFLSPDVQKPKQPRKGPKDVDIRFQSFIDDLKAYHEHKCNSPFNPKEPDFATLKKLLAENKKLDREQFRVCLTNRARANEKINHLQPWRFWLLRVVEYQQGPLDRYWQPIPQEGSSNGYKSKTQLRSEEQARNINAGANAAVEEISRRKNAVGAEHVSQRDPGAGNDKKLSS